MSEAEQAWRLWHLLQLVSDALWSRYESAFLDFCGEESCQGRSYAGAEDTEEQPF
jgi:hypothetical protein